MPRQPTPHSSAPSPLITSSRLEHLISVLSAEGKQMDTRLVAGFAILLIALVHANSTFEPISIENDAKFVNGELQDNICGSCLKASKKAEKVLTRMNVLEDAEMLSVEVCHSLPSDLKIKCLEKSAAYLYQTKFRLQDLFHERSLCNSTGLCVDESVLPTQNVITSWVKSPESCVDCRRAVRSISDGLESARLKHKILAALIDHCEEKGENDKECKKGINKFLPISLSRIQEMEVNDICRAMHQCRQPKSI